MDKTQMWYAGVDWASEKHDVWLTDDNGKYIGKKAFKHGGEGLAQMCAWLIEKTKARPDQINVAIETSRGPVVDVLLDREFNVCSINPKQLDRFRDRFSPSGSKDDDRDSETLASSLRTDPRAFRKLARSDAALVELREWSRMIENLTAESVRLANRLRDQLWRYYPQVIELYREVDAPWVLETWKAAPTPAKAAELEEATVAEILKKNRIRCINATKALEILKKQPLIVASGVTEAAQAHSLMLCEQIEVIRKQLKDARKQRDRLLALLSKPVASEEEKKEPEQAQKQRDAAILRSMPGVGGNVAAALLTEAAEAVQNRHYQALRALSASAPVTRRSGKSCRVTRRLACHPRVRNAVYHWSNVARLHDETCKAKYASLRARGHSHARALRSIGDRLLYVACTLLKKGVLYDPAYAATKAA
jgi:transposase